MASAASVGDARGGQGRAEPQPPLPPELPLLALWEPPKGLGEQAMARRMATRRRESAGREWWRVERERERVGVAPPPMECDEKWAAFALANGRRGAAGERR